MSILSVIHLHFYCIRIYISSTYLHIFYPNFLCTYEFIFNNITLPSYYNSCLFHVINHHHTYMYHEMLQCQILPSPPTVEDTIYDVALTPYNRPESTFNLQGWEKGLQRCLLQLFPHSPTQATAVLSTDHISEAIIPSAPLQLQPQHYTG